MTKITIADTQSIHPNLSSAYLGDQMNQLAHALSQTTPAQDDPMTIHMTFQEFLNRFTSEGQALYYIDNILAENRIEVSEKTLPFYTWTGERFVAYADHAPQTHSFEMRIERWYEDDDSSADAIVTFERGNGLEWFLANLHHELDGIIDESEMYWEDTPQNHRRREIDALHIQRAYYEQRINAIRCRLIENGAVMSPAQFEQGCKDVADFREKSNHASERIEILFQ